ncbi:MAG: DUF4145 domain-containing protein [Spirochaetaceae bacterium]|jgi:hypothetical protein|nr:DUF4145 domain-containing protein [Spirochaetaceae bacterium]
MSDSFNWTCPYCKTKTTIFKRTNFSSNIHLYASSSKFASIGLVTSFIVCPNPDCRELVIEAGLYHATEDTNYHRLDGVSGEPILKWTLKPESSAMTLPDYIPKQISEDYYEACRILSLSPKASATLARRCLQGMIRDFWGVVKGSLSEEIKGLQGKIDVSTWDSIDSIRSIGNIGAHMEKDVNTIIDIDEDEAGILIKLLEELFQDWYISKHDKDERHQNIIALSAAKKSLKADGKIP